MSGAELTGEIPPIHSDKAAPMVDAPATADPYLKYTEPYFRIHAKPEENMDTLFTLVLQDPDAMHTVMSHYMPLAKKLSLRYRHQGHQEDLAQVAYLGLFKAVQRYDSERGIGFHHFAIPTILGEMKRYLRDNDWCVHVDRELQELGMEVNNVHALLSSENGREPTLDEIAEYLSISVGEVCEGWLAYHEGRRASSLDLPNEQDDTDGTLMDTIESDDGEDGVFAQVSANLDALKRLGKVSARDLQLLMEHGLRGRTQNELAREAGLSQVQVSRIISKTIKIITQEFEPPKD